METRRTLLALVSSLVLSAVARAGDYCSQPVSKGAGPTITDCLFVAKTSVGSEKCRSCVCDTDDSGSTTISDALRCLLVVIGETESLACAPCPECASCDEALHGLVDPSALCDPDRPFYDGAMQCLIDCLCVVTTAEVRPSGCVDSVSPSPGECYLRCSSDLQACESR